MQRIGDSSRPCEVTDQSENVKRYSQRADRVLNVYTILPVDIYIVCSKFHTRCAFVYFST